MDFKIKRDVHPDYTLGKVYEVLEGKDTLLFYSLERPVGSNRPNIDAIPFGKYEIALTPSNRFSEKKPYKELGGLVPLILNVPNRAGVRIHIANFVRQLEGCIAPGMLKTKDGAVLNSEDAYRIWFGKMLNAHKKKEKITLEIT